jgi:hypothetical protein
VTYLTDEFEFPKFTADIAAASSTIVVAASIKTPSKKMYRALREHAEQFLVPLWLQIKSVARGLAIRGACCVARKIDSATAAIVEEDAEAEATHGRERAK